MAILLVLFASPVLSQAQETRKLSLKEAIRLAEQQNRQIEVGKLRASYFEALRHASVDLPKTSISAELGSINSASFDNMFTLVQGFSMPALYKRQKNVFEQEWVVAKTETLLQRADVVRLVKLAYLQMAYLKSRRALLQRIDSIFSRYIRVADIRFEKGETGLLEKAALNNQAGQVKLQLELLESDLQAASIQLATLLNERSPMDITDTMQASAPLFDSTALQQHPILQVYRQQEQVAKGMTALEKARLLPDWSIGYTSQSIVGWQLDKARVENYYGPGSRFSMVQLNAGIPIFTKAQRARIHAATQMQAITAMETAAAADKLWGQMQQCWIEYDKYQRATRYYQEQGLPSADTILQTANLRYKNGDINYIEWGTLVNSSLSLLGQYIDTIRELNTRKIELEYLLFQNQN